MATNITPISVSNNILTGQTANLVVTRDMVRNFGSPEDYVEMHVSDPSGKIIYSISPFKNYTIPGVFQPSTTYTIQELIFDPEVDLKNLGVSYGEYVVTYNVLRPKIVLDYNPSLFIKEISGDRTEIRLSSNNIPPAVLESNAIDFINDFNSLAYFKEFYLNFGRNRLYPCVNIALDLNQSPSTVLIKLLNPLPSEYKVNDLLTVVDAISNPQIFQADITLDPTPVTFPTLRGPNFDLDLDSLRVGPTPYYNFNQVTSFQGNFTPQLQQLLGQLSASNFAINVDYTDYENFVHFSSAARRLEGFKYKLTNIETFASSSASLASSTIPTAQLDAVSYQNKIDKTIQSFDGWEQYMFYNSSSYAWPKQTSVKPYINYSVTASEAISWYNGNYDSASLYDENNQNYILYTLPGYITENTDNELAFRFAASIGQMFDDIWIHIKAITDLYQAKNALTEGISKDLVYFALQSMGINTYTDQENKNVFQYLYGINPDGTYLPQIGPFDTLISASNYQLSGQDIQKGIYKRLYHNLPLLLKSKGTTRFNQYLNTIFGVPSTIMGHIEYGGVDKITSSFEYEFDKFNYSLNLDTAGSTVEIPWEYLDQSTNRTTYSDIVADGIELRFKAYTTSSTELLANFTTQSLFYNGSNFILNLLYTDTGSSDSIYADTIARYGYLEFSLGGGSKVTSSTVPIFETGSDGQTSWYSVLVQRRFPNRRIGQVGTSQTYDIYIKNNIYGEVGHVASASLTTSVNSGWYNGGSTLSIGGGTYPFSGSVQELRLWSNKLNEETFNSHVLNPESIEGNTTTSSFEDLAARFTLGGNLQTYNHSVTTTLDSTHPDQNTQILTATFNSFPNENNYTSFTETYYADVANSGYANPVNNKIRIHSGSAYGTQLLPHKSIEITPNIPITKDIHLLDASLSPQDEVDRAIIAAFGSTYDLDDIIGDPIFDGYKELRGLQEDFFKKFRSKYNYKDYIRLIDFFHNSLFRTLKDFTPARTNLSTGLVIKPHILERSAVARPEQTVDDKNNKDLTIRTAFVEGSNGGEYNQPLYNKTIIGKNGPITYLTDARDFFTGEIPGDTVNVKQYLTDGVYNPYLTFNPINDYYDVYSSSFWNQNYNPLLNNVAKNRLSKFKANATEGGFLYKNYTRTIRGFTGGSGPSLFSTFQYIDWNGVTRVLDVLKSTSTPIQYEVLLESITLIRGNGIAIDSTPSQPFTTVSFPASIINPVEYQDSNDNYVRHINPRFIGCKTTSTEYNVYDPVYAIEPTINKNTLKIAYFGTAISTGSQNLAAYERTNLYCKYLIDENSSLTELTARNYNDVKNNEFWNLYQVQNIFKHGEKINVSLFNNQKPSNHKNLEGNKIIFAGGYKYYPYLWRQHQEQNLIYYLPEGYPSDIFLDPTKYIATNIQYRTYQKNPLQFAYYFTLTAACTISPKIPFPFSISVTYEIKSYEVTCVGGFRKKSYTDYITVIFREGSLSYDFQFRTPEYSGCPGLVTSVRAVSVIPTNGLNPGLLYNLGALQSYLTVNPLNRSVIIAASDMTNDRYYTGSNPIGTPTIDNIINVYKADLPPEYPIEFNVMDLVRFDSGSRDTPSIPTSFKPQNEFTIVEVYNTTPISFKLDRPVPNELTASGVPYRIDRYIFSKRVPDESNIVIQHKINPGETSGGIIKNSNLLISIEEKVGDIVSNLKNKIFSTVLTP